MRYAGEIGIERPPLPARRGAGPSRTAGVLLALAGATCWSLGGVLIRITEGIDAWQIIFYRSITVLIVMGAWVWLNNRGRLWRTIHEAGINAVVAGIAVGGAGLAFVVAVFYTTVAQVIFMVGIAPFCAAMLGWWLLRERLSAITWGTMVIAAVGLFVMLGGDFRPGEAVGIILALYSAFCFSCYSVLLRWGQRTDMTVAVVWNAIFLLIFSGAVLLAPIPLREAHGVVTLAIGWQNLGVVVVMGAIQLSLGMILFVRGSRAVPAAELALLALIEPTLAPLWVFLAVDEEPALATLVGGAVIMAAIVIQVVFGARRDMAPPPRRRHKQETLRRKTT